jgi:hypothetical protein
VEPFDVLAEAPGPSAITLPPGLARIYGGDLTLAQETVYANFVATIDGVVAIPSLRNSNTVIAGDNDADRFLMGLLRAVADAVLLAVALDLGLAVLLLALAACLAAAFERLTERGQLRTPDPQLAAAHFNWLVTSIPLNQVMLCGDAGRATTAELDRYADAGARAFLAAYGTR